ncbi:MAG: hypothetical protein K9K88_14475 [Desulfobacterales bacterium]|nr:hypothetical protein [Desulfobacterales bacterium]
MAYRWWINNKKLFRKERKALAEAHPLLRLQLMPSGYRVNDAFCLEKECVVTHGVYCLRAPKGAAEIDYRIALLLWERYPKEPPIMYCSDPKLPDCDIDRHILINGEACLGVRAEIGKHWPPGSSIVDFIDSLVAPFLAWQLYYDVFGKVPPWGERSHGITGIYEFYAELLDWPVEKRLIGFMRLLARKSHPKGHEICPCESGKRIRDCHRSRIYAARQKVNWRDVTVDLDTVRSYEYF